MFQIPEFEELVFDEEKHLYRLNGRIIPSVTTLMKPLSQSYYYGIDEDVLNKAAYRGTSVHNAIENFIRFGVDDISQEYKGYFDAFKKWYAHWNPEVLATESRVYHKFLMYAGTTDLACIIQNKTVCIDFKTSATINKALTGVQLEGYSQAYTSHGIVFDQKAIVHLKNDGTYAMEWHDKNDHESLKVFSALITLHSHLQKYKYGGKR